MPRTPVEVIEAYVVEVQEELERPDVKDSPQRQVVYMLELDVLKMVKLAIELEQEVNAQK